MIAEEGQPSRLFASGEYLQCATTVCNTLHPDLQRSETSWCRRNSATRSLVVLPRSAKPNVAVCLLPGTEVAFEKEVECEHALGFIQNWMPGKKLGEKVARFRQVKKEQPHVHHDALEFPDGQIVLLTCLCQGQQATVLQLPADPRTEAEAEEQKRVAVVA
jgi:hypothetical protein